MALGEGAGQRDALTGGHGEADRIVSGKPALARFVGVQPGDEASDRRRDRGRGDPKAVDDMGRGVGCALHEAPQVGPQPQLVEPPELLCEHHAFGSQGGGGRGGVGADGGIQDQPPGALIEQGEAVLAPAEAAGLAPDDEEALEVLRARSCLAHLEPGLTSAGLPSRAAEHDRSSSGGLLVRTHANPGAGMDLLGPAGGEVDEGDGPGRQHALGERGHFSGQANEQLHGASGVKRWWQRARSALRTLGCERA